MPNLRGGMEFWRGPVVQTPPPPGMIPGQTLQLVVEQRPDIQPGAPVTCGQLLVHPTDPRLTRHISPVAGQVREITEHQGHYVISIVPHEPSVPTQLTRPIPRTRKLEGWLTAMRPLGAWGEGDGHVGLLPQLEAALLTRPDTVLCLGADAYPPYPVASSLLRSFAPEACAGLQLLREVTGAKTALMLAERDRSLLRLLRPRCRTHDIKLIARHVNYPAGDPTVAIYQHVPGRRRLGARANPLEQRVLVVRPWTAIRLGRWLASEQVDLARPIFLCWPEADTPMTVAYALHGQPISSLDARLSAAVTREPHRLIHGHPLTGRPAMLRLPDGSWREGAVPMDELAITLVDPPAPRRESPCIACGWCAEVCPTDLRPARLYQLAQSNLRSDQLRLVDELNWCVQCGLCSHVCPSALPLMDTFHRRQHELDQLLSVSVGGSA